MTNTYDDSSIRSLKGAERVRQRPGVMFGSNDLKGAFHTVKEILGNALDEARAGYGNKIVVTYHNDGSISVLDYGRGVPMGWNEEESRFNWDLIFNELYAGGKYEEDNEDYMYSIGLNGLGAAATQYTSEWMDVVSYRTDVVSKKSFKKGIPTDDELEVLPNTDGVTGTYIRWKIDTEVFPDTDFTSAMFESLLESQAHLNAITLVFNNEYTGTSTTYEGHGCQTFLGEQLGDKVIDFISKNTEGSGHERGKKYNIKVEVVLAVTEETVSKQLFFHNTGEMRTGVHADAFNSAVTDFFKDISKEYGVKIVPYDYSSYLSAIVSSYSNITSFANQIKDGVSNQFIYYAIYNTVLDLLKESQAMNRESIQTLIERTVVAARARKKAKELEAQERLVNKVSSQRKQKPSKFIDCSERNPAKRELYIVEGDSAALSVEVARYGSFQAILPLKGKPMNGMKASIEDLLNNEEVKNIISVLGTGVDLGGESGLFNLNRLQYDKIIVTTDADIDGNQIRVLVYTIFYTLMPQLLEAGKVFVAETPLFEIIVHDKGELKSLFAYDVKEKDLLLEDCKAKGIAVKKMERSKGLGQNNPDMMRLTTMSPETRRLIPLTLDPSDPLVRGVSDMLFGKDVSNERKEFVFSLLEEKLADTSDLDALTETVGSLEEVNSVEEDTFQ